MNHHRWQLPIPDDFRKHQSLAWLITAVAALLMSGLFVILIVASRTPGVQEFFPWQNFFHMAIVAHVDFSVLVWFAALGGLLWSLTSRPSGAWVGWLALALVIAGSLLLAIGPFQPGQAIMSNYVPVVDNSVFLLGLAIFGFGVLLGCLHALFNALSVSTPEPAEGVMRFGVHTGVIALVLAAGALIWSLLAMPDFLFGPQYYEVLFWGGGHIMQFAWVQFMLVAWLWLAWAGGLDNPLGPRLTLYLLLAGIAPAFLSLWAYLYFDVGSPGHRTFFIWLMAAAGGVAAGPIGLALTVGWWRSRTAVNRGQRAVRAYLMFSIALFGIGGALGFLINESNTMVPAHYHGCIVAITLTFMGLALHLLPAFGLAPARARLLRAIPWVYGPGQLLHILGLAFSGGHGVQRKTAGADQGLESLAQIGGMAVMGLGGLIAIIGGVLFLAAFADALWRSRRQQAAREVAGHA